MENSKNKLDLSEKNVLSFLYKWSIKLIAPLLFGALVHFIVAPWSDEIAIIIFEGIALIISVSILFTIFLLLNLFEEVNFFRNFGMALLGIIILFNVYSPPERTQLPDEKLETQICDFFSSEKSLNVEEIKIRRRYKGFFDIFSKKLWFADIRFSNSDKSGHYGIYQSLGGEFNVTYFPTFEPSIDQSPIE